MTHFEAVRAHLVGHHTLIDNDPYLISFELDVGKGRRQGIYLLEMKSEDGRRYLRISSPIAPLVNSNAERALRFNWAQRVGYFAVSDLEGEAYLHLCENRPFEGLRTPELDGVINEIGRLSDHLEQQVSQGQDLL